MNLPDWLLHCSELLSQRQSRAQFRQRRVVLPGAGESVTIDSTRYINFASNDYLGLARDPQLQRRVSAAAADLGTGSGAAGLITGFTQSHAGCEARIAAWKNVEASVLLPSGYQANIAAVQTLAAIGQTYSKGARFIVDKLAHASLIDAVRSTQSEMRIFPHNNLAKLKRLLQDDDPAERLQVVLTESIFSMDGDSADLAGLAELKREHPFVLLLDEAHGSGVYGTDGAGLASELGLQGIVDVSVATLSKAVGCAGGAICSSTIFRDAVLNFGRAYIYSTSIPPGQCESIVAAIDLMQAEPQRQARVRGLAKCVRSELQQAGLKLLPGDSPIIPIVLGSESAAMDAAEKLRKQGIYVVAVRPPTVAPGASRLRVTLSSAHTDEQISMLIEALKSLIA